jgi:hypothetical protein
MATFVGRMYRQSIRRYAGMRALEVWYSSIDVEQLIARAAANPPARRYRDAIQIPLDEARRRDHISALGKLSVLDPVTGGWLIRDRPPLLQRLPARAARCCRLSKEGLPAFMSAGRRVLVEAPPARRGVESAGVGSVGTRCYVALFAGPGRRPAHPAGQGGPAVGTRVARQTRAASSPG